MLLGTTFVVFFYEKCASNDIVLWNFLLLMPLTPLGKERHSAAFD